MRIGNREIGRDQEPLVIAELGINHGGSLETAFEMVDAASRAGVEVLKHQTHVVEDEMILKARTIKPGNSDRSIYDIMNSCALTEEEELELMKYIESKGMIFISTPFSRAAAERLFRFKVKAIKIGSGECNNIPLLKHVASAGLPVILSTGMNDMFSVKRSVAVLESFKIQFSLMHTTNLYPTPYNLVRLGALKEMIEEFPNIPIGLSDHTISNTACIASMAMGASLVERHFTDRMDRIGPDIICSMDEFECSNLIEAAKHIHEMKGGTKYSELKEEQVTRDFAYASVVSIAPITKGEILSKENVWVRRPGDGEIQASDYEKVINMKAKRNIDSGVQLKWSDFE